MNKQRSCNDSQSYGLDSMRCDNCGRPAQSFNIKTVTCQDGIQPCPHPPIHKVSIDDFLRQKPERRQSRRPGQ